MSEFMHERQDTQQVRQRTQGVEREPAYPWYALRVRAGQERITSASLRGRGLEDFLPTYTVTRRWSDRLQRADQPLFPGYIFCRFDFSNRLPVVTTQGVVHIVGLGKLPCPVDETEIQALQTIVQSKLTAQPWPFLKVGHKVTIQEGPLRNVAGIIADMKGQEQLVVSVTLLQRSVAVHVQRDWIRPHVA